MSLQNSLSQLVSDMQYQFVKGGLSKMNENLHINAMADDLLVSIIIPVYNVKEYLARCLESCTVQQMKNSKHKYEVICVDDGSTDNSLEIIREYASKYDLIKIICKNNKGVS